MGLLALDDYEYRATLAGLEDRPTSRLYAHAGQKRPVRALLHRTTDEKGNRQPDGASVRTYRRARAPKHDYAAMVERMAFTYAQARRRDGSITGPLNSRALQDMWSARFIPQFAAACRVRGATTKYRDAYDRGFRRGLVERLQPAQQAIETRAPIRPPTMQPVPSGSVCVACGHDQDLWMSHDGLPMCRMMDACERRRDLQHYRKPSGGSITVPTASVKVEYQDEYKRPEYDLSTRQGWRIALALGDKTIAEFEQWLDAQAKG